jgi:mRNA interferase RelE/StbE
MTKKDDLGLFTKPLKMTYAIKFRPSVEKNLRTLPRKELIKIKRKLEALAENLPDQAITKMKGNNEFHKIRAGDYRIIYEIHDDTLVILVAKIGHRKDIYKRLPVPS